MARPLQGLVGGLGDGEDVGRTLVDLATFVLQERYSSTVFVVMFGSKILTISISNYIDWFSVIKLFSSCLNDKEFTFPANIIEGPRRGS